MLLPASLEKVMRRGLSDVDLAELGVIGTRFELGVWALSGHADSGGKGAVLLYESYSSLKDLDGGPSLF